MLIGFMAESLPAVVQAEALSGCTPVMPLRPVEVVMRAFTLSADAGDVRLRETFLSSASSRSCRPVS